MLLKQRREPFDEPKWDGWRALAMVQDGRVLILSRNGRDLTKGFHGVAQAVSGLPSGTVIDGELVILDAEGRPDFGALNLRNGAPCLLAFDLLRLEGTTSAPSRPRSGSVGCLIWRHGSRACAFCATPQHHHAAPADWRRPKQ